jgi:hypothetical protein
MTLDHADRVCISFLEDPGSALIKARESSKNKH